MVPNDNDNDDNAVESRNTYGKPTVFFFIYILNCYYEMETHIKRTNFNLIEFYERIKITNDSSWRMRMIREYV